MSGYSRDWRGRRPSVTAPISSSRSTNSIARPSTTSSSSFSRPSTTSSYTGYTPSASSRDIYAAPYSSSRDRLQPSSSTSSLSSTPSPYSTNSVSRPSNTSSTSSPFSTYAKPSFPYTSVPSSSEKTSTENGGSGVTYTSIPIHSNGTNGYHHNNNNDSSGGLTSRGLECLKTPAYKKPLEELKNVMSEMPSETNEVRRSSASSLSKSKTSMFNNRHTSPSLSINSDTQPSSGEINIDDFDQRTPIVASPLGSELADFGPDFSQEIEKTGLNSPGLVSTMSGGGYNLHNSSPLNNFPAMKSADKYTSSSSREERKSSSSVKKMSSSMSSSGSGGSNMTSTEHHSETASATNFKSVQSGGVCQEEKSSAFQTSSKSRLEKDGVVAEKEAGLKHKTRMQKVNDTIQQESQTAAMNSNKLKIGDVTAENSTAAHASSKSSLDGSTGRLSSESHASTASSKKMSISGENGTETWESRNLNHYSNVINKKMNKDELDRYLLNFEDLDKLGYSDNLKDVEDCVVKYAGVLSNTMDHMKQESNEDSLSQWFTKVNNMLGAAVTVPRFGHDMSEVLCGVMKSNGGLDFVMDNLNAKHSELQFNSAKILNKVLTTENKNYVVEKGLDKALAVTKNYTKANKEANKKNPEHCRVATGILENLFDHSEETCGKVIEMGGLMTVVEECKSTDPETLRHCASALANAAIYGGSENQEEMIKKNVPNWLFTLLFNDDESIRYYACLAIAVLGANKEIEAEIQKTDSFKQVMPILAKLNPTAFSELMQIGKSKAWLLRLLPVLSSEREESKNLAAFHFCMEAEKKVKEGKEGVFEEIGAIDALKKVASSPNGIASKYAAQALRTLGEDIPHKLSQQVPTWSVKDVKEWVKQIGFSSVSEVFEESRVDGDLLLLLSEQNLREDIHMTNGIHRRRFLRELTNLRKRTDYSSVDGTGLNEFLQTIGPEYSVYTYDMLHSGVDKETLLNPINPFLTDEQLLLDCGIGNKIHRIKILQGIKMSRGDFSYSEENLEKNIDIFISYRRSNGSQLASLLKVHLELQKQSVFLDVSGLEAGKFDQSLLQHIRQSKNFLLVCTPGALDRCIGDEDQKDWIHKEVSCALASECNIIPIIDYNFVMPDCESLPESMRNITKYNGVRWIHDYQEACIEKIVKFISGDDRLERWVASSGGSQYSYGRQNTYQRTISQDSNANSMKSESDTFINCQKDSQ